MLKVNHDTIEYNLDTVLEFKPHVDGFVREEVRNLIEFGVHDSQAIYEGDYVEKSAYDDLEVRLVEKLEQATDLKHKLQGLLNDLDVIMENMGKKTAAKLDRFAAEMTGLVDGIET